ncbi:copper chaperone PCu(A)C [Brevundimonas sp. VNH65]|uniref:copper chaperone PCu(A)C n=1 Tax=Brevundimonas sp. VNH65 TaxID=3400917 RepID=UPI003BFAA651
MKTTNATRPRAPLALGLFLSGLILPGLALLSACGDGGRNVTKASVSENGVNASVEIRDPWCRPSPNGATAGACYAVIEASSDNRLTGVATPQATEVQIHDMVAQGDMMTMTPLPDGLALKGGEKVVLEPGAKHLMLIGLTAPLTEGQAVALTFTFSATPAMTVQAPVRQPKT